VLARHNLRKFECVSVCLHVCVRGWGGGGRQDAKERACNRPGGDEVRVCGEERVHTCEQRHWEGAQEADEEASDYKQAGAALRYEGAEPGKEKGIGCGGRGGRKSTIIGKQTTSGSVRGGESVHTARARRHMRERVHFQYAVGKEFRDAYSAERMHTHRLRGSGARERRIQLGVGAKGLVQVG
jgi:hypothetical protein